MGEAADTREFLESALQRTDIRRKQSISKPACGGPPGLEMWWFPHQTFLSMSPFAALDPDAAPNFRDQILLQCAITIHHDALKKTVLTRDSVTPPSNKPRKQVFVYSLIFSFTYHPFGTQIRSYHFPAQIALGSCIIHLFAIIFLYNLDANSTRIRTPWLCSVCTPRVKDSF